MSTLASLLAFAATPDAGKKVTSSTSTDQGNGHVIVNQTPKDLAAAAGVDVDTYSVARMLGSEGYGGKATDVARRGETVAKVAKAQVLLNAKGRNVTAALTKGGRYGSQKYVGYAATSRDPSRLDIAIAKAVLSGTVEDVAKGAEHFLAPSVWGNAERAGKTATQGGVPLRHGFQQVVDKWRSAWIGDLPGVDPYYFMVLKIKNLKDPQQKAEFDLMRAKALAVYDAGVRRQNQNAPWYGDIATAAQVGGSALAIIAGFAALMLYVYRRYY